MSDSVFPPAFSDLESFADWALATERERNSKRLASAMQEIQTFYNALLPRMDAVMDYLNALPLQAMPEPAQRLLWLTLSLAEVAPAVELFRQPGVPDGYDVRRFIPVHQG